MGHATPYMIRQRKWSALRLLQSVDKCTVRINAEKMGWLREFLWYDLCAELDAKNLYGALTQRRGKYSPEFWRFADAWYEDEMNHARGFARVMNLVFGVSDDAIMVEAESRPHDFGELEEFLDCELPLCVVFAYDEYASVMTYSKDKFYGSLGSAALEEWIRRVRGDEAIHFGNLVRLIRHRFPRDLTQVEAIIKRVIKIEQEARPYRGTFLFDHECPHFQVSKDDLETVCAATVLRKIQRTFPGGDK